MALPLVLQPAPLTKQSISPVPANTIAKFLSVTAEPSFPDMRANYQHTVVEPQQAAEKAAAEQAAAEAEAARQAALYVAPQSIYIVRPTVYSGELAGSYGYAIAGGNCVNQVPVGLRGEGNPINWPVTTQTPYIGGAALWAGVNHVARVVGLWSNGDIEVAQENWSGPAITRFPLSTFRGFR